MQAADKVIFCFFIPFFFEIIIKQLRIIASVSSEGIVGGVEFFCNGKIGHSLFLVGIIQTINYTAMVCMILVVINEKYNYKFDLPNGVNYALSDYNVIYQSEIVEASPILEGICYKGKIQVQTEIVYFEYTQLPALGDEAFFESIQQIIQVKK